MWPLPDTIGVGETIHTCRYSILRKTMTMVNWVERCRCGKVVTVKIINKTRKGKLVPTIHKTWFDESGNLIKSNINEERKK